MRDYQDQLRAENLAAEEQPIPHLSGAQFVGAKKCGECHKKAYKKWESTKHAQATKSLVIGRKEYQGGEWISRIYDAECLACHVTGWHPQDVLPYKSGYVDRESTPLLTGQQCENCHGPGSRHVELEERWNTDRDNVSQDDLRVQRLALQLTKEVAKDATSNRTCYRCHDLDNSPGFKFDKYWPDVEHRGRD